MSSCPDKPPPTISHLINSKAFMLQELRSAFKERAEEMAENYVNILELKARSDSPQKRIFTGFPKVPLMYYHNGYLAMKHHLYKIIVFLPKFELKEIISKIEHSVSFYLGANDSSVMSSDWYCHFCYNHVCFVILFCVLTGHNLNTRCVPVQ